MPTLVQFDGGETLTLDDEFDQVNMLLGGQMQAGQFTGLIGGRYG